MAYTIQQKYLCLEMASKGCTVAAIREATGFTKGQVVGFNSRRASISIKQIQTGNKVVSTPHKNRVHVAPIPLRVKHTPPPEIDDGRRGSDKPLVLHELTSNNCRWMLDESHYCGAVTIVKNGKLQSYCKTHYKICYGPPNKEYK